MENLKKSVEDDNSPKYESIDQEEFQDDSGIIAEEIKKLNLELKGKGGRVTFSERILNSPLKLNHELFRHIKACCEELK